MRYSRIITVYPFKVYSLVVFSAALELCIQYHTQSVFITPERNLGIISSHSCQPPSPRHLNTNLFSVWKSILELYVNRIIVYNMVVFCDCLLSLSMKFSGFIQVVTCISTLFLFRQKYSIVDMSRFIYPFISWWMFE